MGRVISYGEKTGYNDGDYLLLDNGSGGTKRIRADRVGVQLDPTLSQSGQAADAKVVGDRLNGLDESLLWYNTFNILQKIGTFTNASTNGVDFAWSDNGRTLTITGTSTKQATRNIYYKLNGLPFGIEAGKTYYFNAKRSGDGTGIFQVYYYSGSSNITADVVKESRYITIPENADGLLIRATVYSGQLGDVVFSDIGLFLPRTNTVVNPSNEYKDVAGIINKELESNGLCILGPGVFFVTHIDMPENSALIGSGPQTKIILMGGNRTEGYVIKMASRCTVSNMSILGRDADYTSNDSAYPKTQEYVNRHGILWEGNYSSDGTDIQRRGLISNCYIANFSGGGITCRDNGMNVISGVNVTDCIIWYCYAGIYIPYVAEFNRFENVVASNCYYGAINNGGNNCFSNCNFSKNVVGFLIDNSSGQSPNNGHGSVSNCIFDHSDGNTGIGIHLLGVTPGEVFVGCQLFYSQIVIENSNGVNFIGLNAGWAEKISVTGGSLVMFNDCVFRTHPDVTIDNNDIVKFTNCYTYDGTPVEKNNTDDALYSVDFVKKYGKFQSGTTHGITFTWTNGKCHIHGTSDAQANNNIYYNAVPKGMNAGDNFIIRINADSKPVGVRCQFLDSNGAIITQFVDSGRDVPFTVPDGAVTWLLRLYVNANVTVTSDVTLIECVKLRPKQMDTPLIVSFVDDDTSNDDLVTKFHDACCHNGIKGNYAVITSRMESGATSEAKLLEYEDEGFGMCVHCYQQTGATEWGTMPRTDRIINACRTNLLKGMRQMQEKGFQNYRYWITPGGIHDDGIKEMSKQVGNTCLIATSDGRANSLQDCDFFHIKRISLSHNDSGSSSSTMEGVKTIINNTVAAGGGWLIITTHFNEGWSNLTWDTTLDDDGYPIGYTRFNEIVQYALSKGMIPMSIPQAFQSYKFILAANKEECNRANA